MWNTILFDLDGTLTDSGEGITKSVQYALEKAFDIHVEDPHDLDCFVGPPLKDMFMEYAGLTNEQGELAVETYRERYRDKGLYENRLYDGIGEVLARLSSEGFTLAVCSSKPTDFCVQILRYFGIAHYFRFIIGSEMDGRKVKKAEILTDALYRLGMQNRREQVVLIGDRRYDVEGAKQVGIASVGVTWGYGSREELEACWPDCIVDNPGELSNLLIGQAMAERDPVRYQTVNYRQAVAPAARTQSPDGSVLFRIWRIIYPVLIDFSVSNFISVIFMAVLAAMAFIRSGELGMLTLSNDFVKYLVIITGVADLVMIPVMWLLFREDEKKRYAMGRMDRIPAVRKIDAVHIAAVIALTISTAFVLAPIITALPVDPGSSETLDEAMQATNPIITLLSVCLIGPIFEEMIFRAVTYRRLRDYLPFWPAVIISALIFGVIHGNLPQGIFATCFGILLALVYEHYGDIRIPMLVHIINNTLATVAEAYILNSRTLTIICVVAGAVSSVVLIWFIFVRDEKANLI